MTKSSLLKKDIKLTLWYASTMMFASFTILISLGLYRGMHKKYGMAEVLLSTLQFSAVFALSSALFYFSVMSLAAFMRGGKEEQKVSRIRAMFAFIFLSLAASWVVLSYNQYAFWEKSITRLISVELIPKLQTDQKCIDTFLLEAYEDGNETVLRCGNNFWIGLHKEYRIPTKHIQYMKAVKR